MGMDMVMVLAIMVILITILTIILVMGPILHFVVQALIPNTMDFMVDTPIGHKLVLLRLGG